MKASLSKKYFPDFKDFADNRKKRLDKTSELLYNIRTRVVDERVIPFTDPIFAKHPAQRVLAEALDILDDLRSAVEKADFGGAPPVIAGGFARDLFFGCKPKDIDFFIPTPEGRDPDDYAVYVLSFLNEGLFAHDTAPKFDPAYSETSRFTVYGNDLRGYAAGVDFITDAGASVEEIVSRFDYDLVKCYIDKDGLHLSDEFRAAVKSKTISTDNLKTHTRINRWIRRNGVPITVTWMGEPLPEIKTWDSKYFLSALSKTTFDIKLMEEEIRAARNKAFAAGDIWGINENELNL